MNEMGELVLYASPIPNSTTDRVMDRRKRRSSEGDTLDSKRPRYSFYFRLESESSIDSDDDTESVYSIQAKETDVVRDTSDTDSDTSSIALEVEYEVASLSSENDEFPDYTSSGTEDLNLQTAGAIAAVLMDTSMEAWETDGETSESSSVHESLDLVDVRKDFWTCVQCNSRKDNKFYRYCNKCFQVRKTFFPPRPRGSRKRKRDEKVPEETKKVKLDTLKSCLNQLKEDKAGASSSSGSQSLCDMNFESIVIPTDHTKKPLQNATDSDSSEDTDDAQQQHTRPKRRKTSEHQEEPSKPSLDVLKAAELGDSNEGGGRNRKLGSLELKQLKHHESNEASVANSEQSLSSSSSPTTDECVVSKFETESNACPHSDSGISCRESSQEVASSSGECASSTTTTTASTSSSLVSDTKSDLCIICNAAPKNGIFLHGSIGHMCCCYKCAMRTWRDCKRCPLCNCKVKNVVKLFTM